MALPIKPLGSPNNGENKKSVDDSLSPLPLMDVEETSSSTNEGNVIKPPTLVAPVNTTPSSSPSRKTLPTAPVGGSAGAGRLPAEPVKVVGDEPSVGRFLDDDEDDLYRRARKGDIGEVSKAGLYQQLGDITAHEVITEPYDKLFKRLEPKVVEIRTWLQEYITQEDLVERVALARRTRGEALVDMKTRLDQLLLRYFSSNPVGSQHDAAKISSLVLNEILGLGPLEPLWQDNRISEIMVNGPKRTYIEIEGKLHRALGVQFRDTEHLLETVQQILAPIGKTLDIAHPYEDGRLPDGSRINATHPIIGPDGPYVTIRRFPETVFSLRKLIDMKSMTPDMAEEIGNLIYHQCSTIISGGTGSGKALALDTLIPTPTGFTVMGDLKVGDKVLDENGSPTNVIGFYPQPLNTCYKVTFCDGSTVVADENHNWVTSTAFSRHNSHVPLTSVVTTKQIFETMNNTEDDTFNHAVQLVGNPIQYSTKKLPFNPYLFGLQLAGNSFITNDTTHWLNMIAVGDITQREQFINGVFDVAGVVNTTTGCVELPTNNVAVAERLKQILCSLGFSVTYTNNVLTFFASTPVFKSSHEAVIHKKMLTQFAAKNVGVRFITNVETVPSVHTACITVDSPNSMYLITDSYIPTHNTSMLNALSGCIPDGDRIITIEDTLELRLHPDRHVVPLEQRKSLQGAESKVGNVTIRDLVKNSLRMRPTRIVIGEVRDGTAYDMLQAMNTGHEGSLTTIHANHVVGAIDRLSNLIAQVGELSANQALTLISSGVDIIVSISKFEDGSRRVETIAEIPSRVNVDKSGYVSLDPLIIWEFKQTGLDENNKVVGEYIKVNDYSDAFKKQHRLDNKRRLPLEELLALSDWDGQTAE